MQWHLCLFSACIFIGTLQQQLYSLQLLQLSSARFLRYNWARARITDKLSCKELYKQKKNVSMTLTNQERRNVNVESIHCRHYSMRRRHRQIFRYESHKWYLEMFCTRLTPWRRSRNQAAEYRVVDMIAAFTRPLPYPIYLDCGVAGPGHCLQFHLQQASW